MNSIFFKLLSLVFLLGTMAVRSQTVNWGSLTGSDIVDSQGQALDNTFIFQLGAFEAGFIPDQTNINLWDEKWRVFDTANYSNSLSSGGYFTGTQDLQDVASYSSMFAGLTAYLWIRNDTLTEHFLSTSTDKPGAAEWKFPTLDAGCCPNSGVTTWSVSNFGSDVPIWGSQGSQIGGGDFTAPGPFDIRTHVVPEPTSAVFVALFGFYAAMLRRRRFKN